jgi:hypothetical protein
MLMKRSVIAVPLLLLVASASRAEINVADSLEWMTVDCRLIVQGKVVRSVDRKGEGGYTYRDVTVEIGELIKGKHEGKTLTFSVYMDPTGAEWKVGERPHLFFLKDGDPKQKDLAGRLVPRDWTYGAVDLGKPQRVYLSGMKKAEDGKTVLATVRAFAAWKPLLAPGEQNVFAPKRGWLMRDVPADSPIFNELWAGSSVLMRVPAEEKYRAEAMKQVRSQNAHERAHAADMLRNYPCKETTEALTALLKDPTETKWKDQAGKLVRITYDVRRAAYEALVDLGEKPEKPLFEREPAAGDRPCQ